MILGDANEVGVASDKREAARDRCRGDPQIVVRCRVPLQVPGMKGRVLREDVLIKRDLYEGREACFLSVRAVLGETSVDPTRSYLGECEDADCEEG